MQRFIQRTNICIPHAHMEQALSLVHHLQVTHEISPESFTICGLRFESSQRGYVLKHAHNGHEISPQRVLAALAPLVRATTPTAAYVVWHRVTESVTEVILGAFAHGQYREIELNTANLDGTEND